MSIVVQFAPEVEEAIRREAARQGLSPETVIQATVQQRLAEGDVIPEEVRARVRRDAELVAAIGSVLDGFDWERYRLLQAQQSQERISPEERDELLSMIDQTEEATARRMGYISELAALRNTPARRLIRELGLRAPDPAGLD